MTDFDEYNLNNRILLHSKFSTNPANWFNWIYHMMNITGGIALLELGAGNGEMWVRNSGYLPNDISIVISDISDGFVSQTKARLDNKNNIFKFEALDIHRIPYDNCFDKILANTMLYHSQNLDLALDQVGRALKKSGEFYATTSGLDHLAELKEMVIDYDDRCVFPLNGENKKFCKENGKAILSGHFDDVRCIDFENALIIDDFDFLINFVLTFADDENFNIRPISENLDGFRRYLNLKYCEGQIKVTKSNCMFIARNT